jgi:hypothetical protein
MDPANSAKHLRLLLLGAAVLALLAIVVVLARGYLGPDRATVRRLRAWIDAPQHFPHWRIDAGDRCGDAVMVMPTSGTVGWAWDTSFRPRHRHSGLDIFSPDGQLGVTPVVAAADGLLSRAEDWRSTVIIRHPDLEAPGLIDAGDTVWTYYTHMASVDGATSYVDPAFPPGTRDMPVTAGARLGYQGRWSGSPAAPTGLHLHFSVVRSTPEGSYADETDIANTYDPVPFLGLSADAEGVLVCAQ